MCRAGREWPPYKARPRPVRIMAAVRRVDAYMHGNILCSDMDPLRPARLVRACRRPARSLDLLPPTRGLHGIIDI